MQTNRQLIIALLIIVVVGVAGYIGTTFVTRIGKVPMSVNIIPTDARITINGQKIHQGVAYLNPGEVQWQAERDGFESSDGATDTDITQSLFIDLEANSEIGRKWLAENEKAISEFERRSGEVSVAAGKQFTNKNPITAKLPYQSMLFDIGYQSDPEDKTGNTITITIHAPEQYRQDALEYIRDLGFNPGDFTYKFDDERNPFTS